MSEVQRVVAMERKHNLFVVRLYKVGESVGTVIPVTAHNYNRVGSYLPYPFNALVNNAVPSVAVAFVRDLVQKLESNASAEFSSF